MKIPKYVIDLMSRAKYNYTLCGNNYAAGYTIDIAKYSHYETADTFSKEIDRLQKWVERQGGKMIVINRPILTRHNLTQYAIVTIFDPVMKEIEKYIKDKKGETQNEKTR